jgi:hypothetical protein
MRNIIIAIIAAFGIAAAASSATAKEIYVDGQRVDFVEADNLELCDFHYDKAGNLHITSPKNGFSVAVVLEPGTPTVTAQRTVTQAE